MSFGSTENQHESGNPDYLSPEEMEALTKVERATVQGCMNEMQVLKQKMEHLYDRLDKLIALYGTMQTQFQDFQEQRIKELTLRVGGGPTAHGTDDRPSSEAGNNSAS